MSDVDLIDGAYRKVYSGFIRGKRINSVSLEAEAFFWRLNMLADDYGNLRADEDFFPGDVGGRRKFTTAQIDGWLRELATARLIRLYVADGDRHVSIDGFTDRQNTRNGRRVRRFTPPNGSKESRESKESCCDGGNRGKVGKPGEVGAITPDQTRPDKTTPPPHQDQSADADLVEVMLKEPWGIRKGRARDLIATHGAATIRYAMTLASKGNKPGGLLVSILRDGIDAADIPKPEPPPFTIADPDEKARVCEAFRASLGPGWGDKKDRVLMRHAGLPAFYESWRNQ